MAYKTKHEFVQAQIMKLIEENNMKPGDRLPSEKVFQDQFDVSRHTVRMALERLENTGIITKEQGSGSFVSYPKAKSDYKKIGVITTYVSDYIFPTTIRGIEQELTAAGYSTVLASTNNDIKIEEQAIRMMSEQHVDGLIVEPTKSSYFNPNIGQYLKMRDLGIPIIMINAKYEELDLPLIALNDYEAGYKATEHLITNNHTKIGAIFKMDDRQGKERLRGFIKACQTYGVEYNSENVIMYETETHRSVIDNEVANMIEEKRVSGIVCYNDTIAMDVLNIVWGSNIKVPDELSIVSHDNSNLATISKIRIDSVNHPKTELGRKAASCMIKMIEDPEFEMESVIYDAEVMIKGSVKKLEISED